MRVLRRVSYFMVALLFLEYTTSINNDIFRQKYDLFITADRLLLIILAIVIVYSIKNKVSDGLLGKFFPTNVFILLFSFMVLPGVLLTSDFSTSGNTSFYSYIASFCLFLFGVVLANLISPLNWAQYELLNKGVKIYTLGSPTYIFMLLILIIGVIIAGISKDASTTSIYQQLFNFINGIELSDELAINRQTGGRADLMAIANIYALTLIIPISAAFIFINGVIKSNNVEKIIGLLLFFITFFVMIANGSRLKGLAMLLFLLISYSYVKPISFRLVVDIALGVVWLLIFQTIALGRMLSSSIDESFLHIIYMSLNRVVERVFLTKGYVTQKVFEYIPDVSNYKEGETLINNSGVSFAQEMFGFIYGSGVTGTAGPQAFGEIYANFGVFSMLLFAFFLGVAIHMLTKFVTKNIRLDACKIVFLSYFTILITKVGYSDVFSFKSNGMHVLIFLFMLFLLFNFLLKRVKNG